MVFRLRHAVEYVLEVTDDTNESHEHIIQYRTLLTDPRHFTTRKQQAPRNAEAGYDQAETFVQPVAMLSPITGYEEYCSQHKNIESVGMIQLRMNSTYESDTARATSSLLDRATATIYVWTTEQTDFARQTSRVDAGEGEDVGDGRRLP